VGVVGTLLPPATARMVPFLLPLIGFIGLGLILYSGSGSNRSR
jgi:hypothetical protein